MKSIAATDFMSLAMAQAQKAATIGEVPVGAVLIDGTGMILGEAHNLVETRRQATAHAELIAIEQALQAVNNKRLPAGCTLYVTLEPCAMCAGAISLARVTYLVFAASDPKGGGVIHGGRFFEQPTCHHRPNVTQDVDYASVAGDLLKSFFAQRRKAGIA